MTSSDVLTISALILQHFTRGGKLDNSGTLLSTDLQIQLRTRSLCRGTKTDLYFPMQWGSSGESEVPPSTSRPLSVFGSPRHPV